MLSAPTPPPRRELRRQSRVGKVRRDFPKYVVEVEEAADGREAQVAVEWVDGTKQTVPAQHAVLLDILDALAPKAQALQWVEEDKEMM